MSHPPILLHVGYIKTATTFLQKQVFDAPAEGLELAAGTGTRAHMVQEILLADDYAFDGEAVRARLEAISQPVRDRGNLPVWSEEMLLGNPPQRRYDGWANARKLAATFPQAKVLITLRRQEAMALSVFREYILGGGALPLVPFLGSGAEAPGYSPILRPDFLHYDRAIAHYQGLFGRENLLVLPQEQLAADPAAYLRRLAEFIGCPIDPERRRAQEHVGEGPLALRLRRASNRFFVSDPTQAGRSGPDRLRDRVLRRIDRHGPRGWGEGWNRALKDRIAARYGADFAESNRRTAALTGLDLAGLGYGV